MNEFIVLLEYKLPISNEYKTEILNLSEELYKEKLEYKIPFDSNITKESGQVELQLTFYKSVMNELGEVYQYVRHTTPTTIPITPISAWSNALPNDAFTSIDKRLLTIDAKMSQLNDLASIINDKQVDNLKLDGKKLQLTSKGTPIGEAVDFSSITTDDEDAVKNIKVVEF